MCRNILNLWMITRDIPTPLLSFPVLMGAVRLLAVWRLLGGDPVVPQREENDIKKARGFPAGKRILAGCGIPFSFGRGAPAGRCEREPISPTGTLGLTDAMGTSGGVPQARPAGSSPVATSSPSKPQATASKKPSAARRHRQIGNASEREEASFLPETSSMRTRKQRRTPAIGRI